jgi:biotin transporter BioY
MLMALLDSIVGACFRDEKAGRVVVFSGDRRTRGYIVRSESEELKIRSFLKMFYFAHFSILLLGYFLGFEWSRQIYRALGSPEAHMFRAMCISAGVCLLVTGVPYFLLWSAYKKSFLSFVSPEDEVAVSGRSAGRQRVSLFIAGALIVLALGAVLSFAIRHKP